MHARISNIKRLLNLEYDETAAVILDSLNELYNPKTILVPTFTYSFTKSGVYHRLFSKAEVGRFSEEARKQFNQHRTPDPIFSFIDINNYLIDKKIDYTSAFDKGGIFEFLDHEGGVILNVDLDKITQTQIHYIEKVNNVIYRYDKIFSGVVYKNESNWELVHYKYNVRDFQLNPLMDYERREKYLAENGALKVFYHKGIKISWISADLLNTFISEALKNDPFFLLKKEN